jgi:type VI secretion system secreted protein Hcp
MSVFLKLSSSGVTVRGESKDPGHPGWIEILSYAVPSSGSSVSSSASGSPSGNHEMMVTKRVDAATPAIYLAAAQGTIFERASLDAVTEGKTMSLVMDNVMIAGVIPSGAGGGDVPREAVTLNFSGLAMNQGGAPASNLAAQRFSSAAAAFATRMLRKALGP